MRPAFRPVHLMAIAGLAGALVLSRPDSPTTAAPWRDALSLRASAAFPRQVDGVTVADVPTRIVAASVTSTEILLSTVPRSRIAAVHVLAGDPRYSAVAAEVALLRQVGAEPEQLLAVRPDLVIVDAFSRAEVPLLLAAGGIPVVRTAEVADFTGIFDNIRRIGWVAGCDAAAEDLVVATTERLAALELHRADVADWRIMNLNGGLDTYGAASLLDAAIRAAGAQNLPAAHGVGGYRKLDIETLLGWRPDALVVGGEPGGGELGWLRQHPGLDLLPCVQRQRVVQVPEALLGATSHRVVEVAERIQSTLRAWGRP